MTSDVEGQLVATQEEEVEVEVENGSSNGDSSLEGKKRSCLSASCSVIGKVLVVVVAAPFLAVALAVSAPFWAFAGGLVFTLPVLVPLCFILMFSLPKKTLERISGEEGDHNSNYNPNGVAGMYNKARRTETIWLRIMFGSLRIAARVSLVMLVGLPLCILVPRLKRVTLLASPLWKWSLLSVTLTAGYFEALLMVMLIILVPVVLMDAKSAALHYIGDLFLRITNVVYIGVGLVSWLAYFGTEKGLKQASTPHHQVFGYVSWTFVSLLVGFILSLLKQLLLMKWSADAICRRFEPKILITSVKYFFIGLAAAGFNEERIVNDLEVLSLCSRLLDPTKGDGNGSEVETEGVKSVSVTKYIMSRKMDLSHLSYVCAILKSLAEIKSPILDRDDEDEDDEVVSWFSQKIKGTTDKCTPDGLLMLFYSTLEEAKNNEPPPSSLEDAAPTDEAESAAAESHPLVRGFFSRIWMARKTDFSSISQLEEMRNNKRQDYAKMANVLWRLVVEECSSADNFTFDDLKIWMVDAHKDCINMGRTLADANGIVSRLDLLMSCFIGLIVILVWILLTGSASTAVLVSIATPLLALTFIFGDTAKTFFQGLIFCFATHPFDVGDRCILDDVELEVKSVNILTTTFTKIGSKEKRLYPNAVLATKPILNLGWQPDPNDVVELTLNSSTNLEDLKQRIKQFFEEGQSYDMYKRSYRLLIKEVGDNVKVIIQFSHVLTVHDLSHSQCFTKKSLQRSDLLDMIKNHIHESQTQVEVRAGDVKNENDSHPMPTPNASSEIKAL